MELGEGKDFRRAGSTAEWAEVSVVSDDKEGAFRWLGGGLFLALFTPRWEASGMREIRNLTSQHLVTGYAASHHGKF